MAISSNQQIEPDHEPRFQAIQQTLKKDIQQRDLTPTQKKQEESAFGVRSDHEDPLDWTYLDSSYLLSTAIMHQFEKNIPGPAIDDLLSLYISVCTQESPQEGRRMWNEASNLLATQYPFSGPPPLDILHFREKKTQWSAKMTSGWVLFHLPELLCQDRSQPHCLTLSLFEERLFKPELLGSLKDTFAKNIPRTQQWDAVKKRLQAGFLLLVQVVARVLTGLATRSEAEDIEVTGRHWLAFCLQLNITSRASKLSHLALVLIRREVELYGSLLVKEDVLERYLKQVKMLIERGSYHGAHITVMKHQRRRMGLVLLALGGPCGSAHAQAGEKFRSEFWKCNLVKAELLRPPNLPTPMCVSHQSTTLRPAQESRCLPISQSLLRRQHYMHD